MGELTSADLLTISRELWEQMKVDCRERAPIEACGIVGGKDGVAVIVYPAVNELNSPVRYQLAPQQQLDLMQSIERDGLEMIAIYHSHPNGPAHPSMTDIENAFYPDSFYLIWSPENGEWACHCFRIQEGMVTEEALDVID